MDYQGFIIIGDSSNPSYLESTKKALKTLKGKLNIIHKEYPELNEYMCTQQLVKLANTPYLAFSGDDDFLVPSGLNMCVEFLEENKEYTAACGVAVRLKTKDSHHYGNIIECTEKRLPIEDSKRASERFLSFMSHAADVHFTVHRIETRLLMYKYVHLIQNKVFASSLLPCCLSVIDGKTKQLNHLFLVRQINDNRYFHEEQGDTYAWITNPEWVSFLNIFNEIILEELMLKDGIKLDEAKEVLKRGLSMYIAPRLGRETNKYYTTNAVPSKYSKILHLDIVKNLKTLTYFLSGPRKLLKKLHSLIFWSHLKHYDISLKTLLNTSSSYHKDFMPIYKMITEQKKNYY